MKTKQKFSLLLIVILFMAGCIPSLHPLYHDKDRVEVPEIIGKWQSEAGVYWEFSKVKDEPSYLLKYSQESTPGGQIEKNISGGYDSFPREAKIANMDVNIVKLGGSYFMDFNIGDNNESLDDLSEMLLIHLVTAHSFAKLEIVDGQPQIQHLDPKWLADLFNENKIRIKHEEVDGEVVLTASTDDLQKFITKYADDKDAFLEPEILTPYELP